MQSGTALMSKTATDELDAYTNTRKAWVTADDQMRSTISYDTSIMIFKNLTGRYNHVKPDTQKTKDKLIAIIDRS